MPVNTLLNNICVVAIIKNEERFIEEWINYHLIIGVSHFFLYDDDSNPPLSSILTQYLNYTTIIPWSEKHEHLEGRNRQTKAYLHAVQNFGFKFQWTAFIDCDEFIVIKDHLNIRDFLADFESAGAICLNWHMFGHNGHYDYPDQLVTSSFTRRRVKPSVRVKSICRNNMITEITSAHFCALKDGWQRMDANNKVYTDRMYEGKTQRAHINHYQCRSFMDWKNRVKRGDVAFDNLNNVPEDHLWRFDEKENLKRFVTTIAVFANEYIDDYMLKFSDMIQKSMLHHKHISPLP